MSATWSAPFPARPVFAAGCVLLCLTTIGCGPGGNGPPTPTPTPTPPPVEVVLEIDQMTGTEPLLTTQDVRGQAVSLAEIYAAGGLELVIRHDESDLPRQESIRLAELHALMTLHSSVDPGAAQKVHILVVTEEAGRPDTLGIMFDYEDLDLNDIPREAFAIFQTAHEGLSTPLDDEMLLTCAHELAHAFNIHHPDWEGQQFETGSTIEGYSLTDTVIWSLSQKSLTHLQDHSRELVLPGSGSLSFAMVTQDHFDAHQAVPRESFDVVDAARLGSVARHSGVSPRAAVRGVASPRTTGPTELSAGSLELSLHPTKTSYVIGEPVVFTVRLENTGSTPIPALSLLDPEYGFLQVSIQQRDQGPAQRFRPAVLYDARRLPVTELEPGEPLIAEARVFFGSGGWTFEKPGSYLIHAEYPATADASGSWVASPSLTIEIEEPQTAVASAAVEALRSAPGSRRFGTQQGLYLLFGGGDHLKEGSNAMATIARTAPDAPHAPAARLALAAAAISPTTDPSRREVPRPRLDEARRYLQGLETETVPPLELMRVQQEFATELENIGRDAEAQVIRRRSFEELQRRPVFENVDQEKLRKIVREPPPRNP